jgi:hypothetical protein
MRNGGRKLLLGGWRRWAFIVVAFVIGWVGRAADLGVGGGEPEILRVMEKDWRLAIERDTNGMIVTARVSGSYGSNEVFRALAKVPSLERVRFSVWMKGNQPSAEGILALTNCPNLTEVAFQCTRGAPKEVFEAIGQVRQIQTLLLVATWPTNAATAEALTKLPALKRLMITFADGFGAKDVETILKFKELNDLHISTWPAAKIDAEVFAPLIADERIRNLTIRAGSFQYERGKAWGPVR